MWIAGEALESLAGAAVPVLRPLAQRGGAQRANIRVLVLDTPREQPMCCATRQFPHGRGGGSYPGLASVGRPEQERDRVSSAPPPESRSAEGRSRHGALLPGLDHLFQEAGRPRGTGPTSRPAKSRGRRPAHLAVAVLEPDGERLHRLFAAAGGQLRQPCHPREPRARFRGFGCGHEIGAERRPRPAQRPPGG
jgi:hypothetical protein